MSVNRMKMDVLCLGEALIEFNQIPDDTNNIYRSGFGETPPTPLSQLLVRKLLQVF